MQKLEIESVRGMDSIKVAHLEIGGIAIGVAVVNGLGNVAPLLEEIRNGRNDIHFVEVMACPGGCINGGGQPITMDMENVKQRMQGLYRIDGNETLRTSHNNPDIIKIYEEYLGEPLGEKSHHLLHTHYQKREVLV